MPHKYFQKHRNIIVFLILALLVILTACGGDDDSPSLSSGNSSRDDATSSRIVDDAPTNTPAAQESVTLIPITAANAPALEVVMELNAHEDYVVDVQFAPDGTHFYTASANGTLVAHETETGVELWDVVTANEAIFSLHLSPDGTTLVTCGSDNVVQLLDTETGTEVAQVEDLTGQSTSVQFSSDGRLLAIGYGDGRTELRDKDSFETVLTVAWQRGRRVFVWDMVFSPDGATLFGAHAGNNVVMWDVATGERLDRLTDHTSHVRSVTISRDGSLLATASEDNSVRVWDVADRASIYQLMLPYNGQRTAFNPDGNLLVATGQDGTVHFWDMSDGVEVHSIAEAVTDGTFWTGGIDFSPDGTRLVYGNAAGDVKILGVVAAETE